MPRVVRDDEKTVTISVRVTPSVRAKLVELAKKRKRTVSQLAAFAIDHWFATDGDKKPVD